MALKFKVIGRKNPPLVLRYDWHKLDLYTLSIGTTVNEELPYVYEKDMKITPAY